MDSVLQHKHTRFAGTAQVYSRPSSCVFVAYKRRCAILKNRTAAFFAWIFTPRAGGRGLGGLAGRQACPLERSASRGFGGLILVAALPVWAGGRGFGGLILAAGFSVLAAGRWRLGRFGKAAGFSVLAAGSWRLERFGKAAGFHLQIPPRQGGMRCMFLFGVKKEPKNRRRFRRGGRTAKRGLRAPLETPGAILWPCESLKRCSRAVTV